MSSKTPIFEQSTSPLYYSNDGRLRFVEGRIGTANRIYVIALDGVEVFRTQERILGDAYIAGYDLRDARDEYSVEI